MTMGGIVHRNGFRQSVIAVFNLGKGIIIIPE